MVLAYPVNVIEVQIAATFTVQALEFASNITGSNVVELGNVPPLKDDIELIVDQLEAKFQSAVPVASLL
jgi:hypothetical protein